MIMRMMIIFLSDNREHKEEKEESIGYPSSQPMFPIYNRYIKYIVITTGIPKPLGLES